MVAAKLCLVVVACLPGTLPTQDDVLEAAVLKALGLKSSPAALRSFVAAKTPVPVADERLAALVRDLAVEDFKTRDAAQAELVRGGPAVAERLRAASQALKHPGQVDLVKGCLIRIIQEWSPKGVASYRAAIRALARRAEAAAVPCLLGALPTLAEDDEVLAAAWRALDTVTIRERAVPKACADARADKHPERRAVAAFLLGRRGTEEQRRQAVGMLADPDPSVRLRAAQGLLGAGDLSGVPALVALLDAKPVTLAWEAEELLVWLAGAGTPKERVGDGHKAAQVRKAWERWRETTKPDWKAAAEAPGRPLLLLVRDDDPQIGSRPTVLLGCDGKVRWEAAVGGQSLVVDRITSQGNVLGFVRSKERQAKPALTLVQFDVGDEPQAGLVLPFSPDSGLVARRWVAGWTLVAGTDGFGFILRGQDKITHSGTLPRFKNRPDDVGEQMSGDPIGEGAGVLWYRCLLPSYQNVHITIFVEPGTGACPPAHTYATAASPAKTKGVRLANRGSVVVVSGGRLQEIEGGRRLWDVRVTMGLAPRVSLACPLVRFGFDDLGSPRRAITPAR